MKGMSNSGFTLIELMIVLAVIGILAAIAYPLYQGSLSKARRTDAQTVMLELALWMERFYTEHHRYDATNSTPPVAVTRRIPAGLTRSPKQGNPRYYSLGLTDLSRLTFTIQATPIQEGVQADDDCGTLMLAHTGAKGVGGAATLAAEDCW